MATSKLYPPTIAGTIPPFYADKRTGTVTITVPFSMNRLVSSQEIGGFSLKVRDAETDTLYGIIKGNIADWTNDSDNSSMIFKLNNTIEGQTVAKKIILGKYYKLQMAYVDVLGNVGYYSTVVISKYTYYPTVSLVGFNRQMTNTDSVLYTGAYHNLQDTTEKCYQYKFTLTSLDGEVLETSGWLIHNSANDTLTYESTDQYQLMYSLATDTKYYIQYTIKTNNNLVVSSPRYQVVGTVSVEPELTANIYNALDYDNGCINVWLEEYKVWNEETKTYDPPQLAGSFALSRASSKENFTIWTRIHYFQLTGQLPETYIFQDFTVEQGETYRYAIQQYNTQGVYSRKIVAEDVYAAFEDAFLFDGEKQLKIRFNPKVTSFKTVLQESKKSTLGSKYPFFFRNGYTEYKEFPISGLISYLSDSNEYFMSRIADLGMPADWQDETDITDENLTYERRFKLAVLDWLNNGEVKLFRSPGEGNYLVRLMNVSLTPNDSLSRMIHTFSCTATEVDDFTPRKLSEYGFLNSNPEIPLQLRFGTVVLNEIYEDMINTVAAKNPYTIQSEVINMAKQELMKTDLLNGFSCQYIKIEGVMPGTQFDLNGERFEIGNTGSYEAHFDTPVRNLYLVNPTRQMGGSFTYGILAVTSNKFDTVFSLTQSDRIYVNEGVLSTLDENWIDLIQDTKHKITKINYMHFTMKSEVFEIDSLEELRERYNLAMYAQNEWAYEVQPLSVPSRSIDYTEPENSQSDLINNEYMAYYQLKDNAAAFVLNDTLFRLPNGELWWFRWNDARRVGAMLVQYSPYIADRESATDPTYITKVKINNEVFDIAETEDLYIPMTNEIPTFVSWGPGVSAEIGYQYLDVEYGVESDTTPRPTINTQKSLATMKLEMETANKLYNACALDYYCLTSETVAYGESSYTKQKNIIDIVRDVDDNDPNYYVWITDKFYRLNDEDRFDFTGTEVWIPYSQAFTLEGVQSLDEYFESDPWENVQLDSMLQRYKNAKTEYLSTLDEVLAIKEKELELADD